MERRAIKLDEKMTRYWNDDNATVREVTRRNFRITAQSMADKDGQTIEIYSADGITLDAIEPQWTPEEIA